MAKKGAKGSSRTHFMFDYTCAGPQQGTETTHKKKEEKMVIGWLVAGLAGHVFSFYVAVNNKHGRKWYYYCGKKIKPAATFRLHHTLALLQFSPAGRARVGECVCCARFESLVFCFGDNDTAQPTNDINRQRQSSSCTTLRRLLNRTKRA